MKASKFLIEIHYLTTNDFQNEDNRKQLTSASDCLSMLVELLESFEGE